MLESIISCPWDCSKRFTLRSFQRQFDTSGKHSVIAAARRLFVVQKLISNPLSSVSHPLSIRLIMPSPIQWDFSLSRYIHACMHFLYTHMHTIYTYKHIVREYMYNIHVQYRLTKVRTRIHYAICVNKVYSLCHQCQ